MANILILGVKVPFAWGGQEVLVGSLACELRARGHLVDVVELPFKAPPKEGLLNQAALWRCIDFSGFCGKEVDLVIATKYPSYYARHPCKSLWLVHQHRPAYDLFAGQFSDFSDNLEDEALRRMIIEADSMAIGECAYVSGISANVTNRLQHFNSIKADVLYPPLPHGGQYRCAESGDFILSVGRLCGIKRVDLMLKAMPIIHSFIKLKIVGSADEPGIMEYLNNEINKHHLWERVEFLGRVSDTELLDLYAKALAVYYAPHNEDYGYVTLEAMASAKPLVTATDSGGVLEFIRHEENGLIVEPSLDGIGHGFNRLVEDRDLAKRLGAAGRDFLEKEGFLEHGWDNVINKLLSPLQKVHA